MRIAISPDENPGDPGSVALDGTTERSLNLLVAAALRDSLARCGQNAWFNPELTFIERVAQANGDSTRVLVACSHNESTPGKTGTQFVFCPGGAVVGSQGLAAHNVYVELAALPGWPPRVLDAIKAVYECCMFEKDTVYVEYLYMSPQDQVLWSRPGYAQAVAEATCRGLAQTYGFAYVPLPQPPGLTGPQVWWAQASG